MIFFFNFFNVGPYGRKFENAIPPTIFFLKIPCDSSYQQFL